MTERPQQTRIKLPVPVYERWRDLMTWRHDDPEAYDLSEQEVAYAKACLDAPPDYQTRTVTFGIDHYGAKHHLTDFAALTFELAFYDSHELDGMLSSQGRARLLQQLEHWRTTAAFTTPLVTRRAPPVTPAQLVTPLQTSIRLPTAVTLHLKGSLQFTEARNGPLAVTLTVPYHGHGHPDSLVMHQQLKQAVTQAFVHGTMTATQLATLHTRTDHWLQTGRFVTLRRRPCDALRKWVLETFRATVEDTAMYMIRQACQLLQRADSPLKPPAGFSRQLRLKISWHQGRRSSRGGYQHGAPWVSLALHALRPGKKHYRFTEYAHIAKSPQIGTCRGPWQVYLAALVAHEVSHALQHTCLHRGRAYYGDFTKSALARAHGPGWQEIYRYLRTAWVNQLDGHGTGEGEH